jgi:hypothetical protein
MRWAERARVVAPRTKMAAVAKVALALAVLEARSDEQVEAGQEQVGSVHGDEPEDGIMALLLGTPRSEARRPMMKPDQCTDCDVVAPRSDTNHTLVSSFGWRLSRRVEPNGKYILEWRCPECSRKQREALVDSLTARKTPA